MDNGHRRDVWWVGEGKVEKKTKKKTELVRKRMEAAVPQWRS